MGLDVDIVTDQTSAHDPLAYLPARGPFADWASERERDPRGFTELARASMADPRRGDGRLPRRRRGGLRLRELDTRRGAARRLRAGVRLPRLRTGLYPAAVLRGQGPVSLGGALGRSPRHRGDGPRHAPDVPRERVACRAGSAWRPSASPSRGSRPGSAGSATASATGRASSSTPWSPRASLPLPIVIGRDHLDAGSVASPYRETEAMADGSDAIADWPLLNALVNASSGASWVSIHHGGGVGIGRSIHAGQVSVADGSLLAEAKLERVLSNDPADRRAAARRRRLRAGAPPCREPRRADSDGPRRRSRRRRRRPRRGDVNAAGDRSARSA